MKFTKTILLLFSAFVLAVTPACTTINPDTGQEEFDQVTTDQVKLAFSTFATTTLRRTLVKTHAKNPNVIPYMLYTSTTLCELRDEGAIDPEVIVRRLNEAIIAEGVFNGIPGEVIDAKNFAIALYSAFYNERHRAELDPEKFAFNALDVLCKSVEQGTFDAMIELGLPPVPIND